MELAVSAKYKVKLEEGEMRDKYLDLAKELKKPRNMTVMVIPIVIGTVGSITIDLAQGLEDLEINGQVETIRNTTLLRSTRILRGVLEI